ncbi:anti-sigma factor [Saccharibacillus deserti]|uniref:anti-sigma factor n=1 Tax=Saccharibacillus deserti TaxID=1634444 RepID=UPI0015582E89|nr:anti-sigma factor [Saccharibacillus deserti]
MNERKESIMDQAEAYALGGLDEAESAEYEAYLLDDANERKRAAELRGTVGMLPLALTPAAPPSGMKRRILARVLGSEAPAAPETQQQLEQARQTIEVDEFRRAAEAKSGIDGSGEPAVVKTDRSSAAPAVEERPAGNDTARGAAQRSVSADTAVAEPEMARRASRARASRGLWAGAATVMAAAAAVLGIYSAQLQASMSDMRSDMTAMQQQTADMERQLASAAQPPVGAKVENSVRLKGGEDDPDAFGMASMIRDENGMRLVVQAENMPSLSGSEAYQIWLIKDGQPPQNAGTFMSDSGSGGLSLAIEPDDYDTVAITLEPDAEGKQPRGRMVMAAQLNG